MRRHRSRARTRWSPSRSSASPAPSAAPPPIPASSAPDLRGIRFRIADIASLPLYNEDNENPVPKSVEVPPHARRYFLRTFSHHLPQASAGGSSPQGLDTHLSGCLDKVPENREPPSGTCLASGLHAFKALGSCFNWKS
eukprot:SM000174S03362  [mRNA]  locus=s174:127665:128203:+ [translate_table: standard]